MSSSRVGNRCTRAVELAGRFEGGVDVVAHEVEPGLRHKAHVADRRDAVRCQALQEPAIRVGDFVERERGDDAGHELHGGRFAHDAGEFAFVVFVVASAHGGHAVAGHAQLGQRAGVEPQGVRVARIQRYGAIGVGRIERMLARHDGGLPAVFAPALRQKPAGRTSFRQRLEARHAVGFGFAEEAFGQRARVEGRMKRMQMGVVQAGADERIAVVDDAGGVCAEFADGFDRHDVLDTAVFDADGRGMGRVVARHPREYVRADDDEVGLHRCLLARRPREPPDAPDVRRQRRARPLRGRPFPDRVFMALRKRAARCLRPSRRRGYNKQLHQGSIGVFNAFRPAASCAFRRAELRRIAARRAPQWLRVAPDASRVRVFTFPKEAK